MQRMGIAHELSRLGANGESVIEISGRDFTLVEQ
jgi:hypothetical protein